MQMMTKILSSVIALTLSAFAHAQTPQLPLDSSINESIVFVKNDKLFPVDLEVTLYKPDGAGPFPVLVINHGKAAMNNRLQPRSRYATVAREFLRRGYAVVIPMRQGFSNSGGAAVGEGCNITGNGEAQATDLISITRWIKAQAWADGERMLMMGQSHGGLATLAYAQSPDPGYKLFVNFAGGLMWTSGSCQWQENLRKAFASYGERTKAPSIWFYGENDSLFPPSVVQPAYQAYVAAGGKAELVAYGAFQADAHGMFGSIDGLSIWLDKVHAKMQANGLPTEVTHAKFASASKMRAPAATDFAKVDDVQAVPCKSDNCRSGYTAFLTKNKPRAFATNGKGPWTWANAGEDPLRRALESCNLQAKEDTCKLYAVDDNVVWNAEK
jgi:dienelactone hydrolase